MRAFRSLRFGLTLAALAAHLGGGWLHVLEHRAHADPVAAACADARDGHWHEGGPARHAEPHACVQCQRPPLATGAAPSPWQASPALASAAPARGLDQLCSSPFLPAAPRRGPPAA